MEVNRIKLKKVISQMQTQYGSHAKAAVALGYSKRAYTDIRIKINNGEPINQRIEDFILFKGESLITERSLGFNPNE